MQLDLNIAKLACKKVIKQQVLADFGSDENSYIIHLVIFFFWLN